MDGIIAVAASQADLCEVCCWPDLLHASLHPVPFQHCKVREPIVLPCMWYMKDTLVFPAANTGEVM